jgi:hypothetical protein
LAHPSRHSVLRAEVEAAKSALRKADAMSEDGSSHGPIRPARAPALQDPAYASRHPDGFTFLNRWSYAQTVGALAFLPILLTLVLPWFGVFIGCDEFISGCHFTAWQTGVSSSSITRSPP